MIDFLKYRYVCLFVSVFLLSVGTATYFGRGGFFYHIDFSGGSEVRIAFDKPIDIAKLRASANDGGWEGAVIQSIGATKSEFLVNLPDNEADIEERYSKEVKKSLPEDKFSIRSVEQVGAQAGKDVKSNAFWAILISMFGLLFYISLRHRYAYAFGAVAALAHDLLVLLAFFLVFSEPISLNILAGILAVLGYSLNDTIVVFSRIKENVELHKGMGHEEIVNLSINQTLKRTLLTSFSTLLTVLTLYLIGGEVLRGFSITMIIAVIVGTYSSVYIASPVMLALNSGQDL
jgi:preprotein translocase subunit SecF